MTGRSANRSRMHACMACPILPALGWAAPLVLLAALALAGCGVSSGSAGGAASTSATATATATFTNPPLPGGTAVRPCPGPVGSASDAGMPALVLTQQPPNKSGTVGVGQLVQVRLPTTQHWELQASQPTTPLVGPGGVEDAALHACVWTFRPSASGQITLSFVGTAICEGPNQPCPQYAILATFAVHVR